MILDAGIQGENSTNVWQAEDPLLCVNNAWMDFNFRPLEDDATYIRTSCSHTTLMCKVTLTAAAAAAAADVRA